MTTSIDIERVVNVDLYSIIKELFEKISFNNIYLNYEYGIKNGKNITLCYMNEM